MMKFDQDARIRLKFVEMIRIFTKYSIWQMPKSKS